MLRVPVRDGVHERACWARCDRVRGWDAAWDGVQRVLRPDVGVLRDSDGGQAVRPRVVGWDRLLRVHAVPVRGGVLAGLRLHHQHVQREHSAHGTELHGDVPARAVWAADGDDAVPVRSVCGDAVCGVQPLQLHDSVHADELRDQWVRSWDSERSDVQRDVRVGVLRACVIWYDRVFERQLERDAFLSVHAVPVPERVRAEWL